MFLKVQSRKKVVNTNRWRKSCPVCPSKGPITPTKGQIFARCGPI